MSHPAVLNFAKQQAGSACVHVNTACGAVLCVTSKDRAAAAAALPSPELCPSL